MPPHQKSAAGRLAYRRLSRSRSNAERNACSAAESRIPAEPHQRSLPPGPARRERPPAAAALPPSSNAAGCVLSRVQISTDAHKLPRPLEEMLTPEAVSTPPQEVTPAPTETSQLPPPPNLGHLHSPPRPAPYQNPRHRTRQDGKARPLKSGGLHRCRRRPRGPSSPRPEGATRATGSSPPSAEARCTRRSQAGPQPPHRRRARCTTSDK